MRDRIRTVDSIIAQQQLRPTDRLAAHRIGVLALLDKYGMCDVKVFGSSARGDDTAGSDLDLIAHIPQMSLLKVARLIGELEDLLGCEVDLVDYSQVPERSRKRVFGEMRSL